MEQMIAPELGADFATLIHDYAAYNPWANRIMRDWLATKSCALLEQHIRSSFPSLKDTLIPIWDTERFWHAVVKEPAASFRVEGFHVTLAEVMEGLVYESDRLRHCTRTLDTHDLTKIVTFTTPWVEGSRSRFAFLHHCLNHSTYHRGQLVTMAITSVSPMRQ